MAWIWVPILYFMEGVPYVVIVNLSAIMYTDLGISPKMMAIWTSLITWPWVVKMFWGPLVDGVGTRRQWIIATQILMAVGLVLAGLSLKLPLFFVISIAILGVMAILSATHDIAADGFYLLALGKRDQALFVGIRSTAYRLAMFFGSGALAILAGRLIKDAGWSANQAWASALVAAGVLYVALWAIGMAILPKPQQDIRGGVRSESGQIPFLQAWITYFSQEKILVILAFIMFYRLGESLILKMASPFLMQEVAKGGLALSSDQVGVIQGTIGIAALIMGGILGGFAIAAFGLKKCLWPMVLALNIPCLGYIWAAIALPGLADASRYWGAMLVMGIDYFGYGFGFAAYMVYLMFVSQRHGSYQTSHYAVSTGLMALSVMLAGIASGYMQEWLGYRDFFIAACVLTIPGMITLLFIPLDENTGRRTPRTSEATEE